MEFWYLFLDFWKPGKLFDHYSVRVLLPPHMYGDVYMYIGGESVQTAMEAGCPEYK